MPHPVPDLPATPPLEWPARGPLGPDPEATDGHVVDSGDDPWTTWQVALIAVVAVLVGLAVGVATGVRMARTAPGPTVAAGSVERAHDASVPPVAAAGADETAQPASSHEGSPADPIPFGTSFLGDGHSLRVLSLGDDGAGTRVRLELVFGGGYSGSVRDVTLDVVDELGRRHERLPSCADGRPGGLHQELAPGEARTVHVCFDLPANLAPDASLVAQVSQGRPVHFALG
jgi:hypothetical protein